MKKVLVIEDDQIVRNLHTRVLENQGYAVITAGNGPDGVALALRERPNMILLDLGLPSPKPRSVEFDGYAVMRWIKRLPATNSIPVVVASAWPEAQARSKSRELGSSAFLGKPVKVQDLQNTARILMDEI